MTQAEMNQCLMLTPLKMRDQLAAKLLAEAGQMIAEGKHTEQEIIAHAKRQADEYYRYAGEALTVPMTYVDRRRGIRRVFKPYNHERKHARRGNGLHH
jgi:hypothetical protein